MVVCVRVCVCGVCGVCAASQRGLLLMLLPVCMLVCFGFALEI